MATPIILFIDDDDTDGIATFHRLTKLGFVARFHRGPFGTLAAIRDTQCDLVLLDVNMPGLDGPALVRVIRHTYAQLPVVLFSNMEKATLERIGRHIGADSVVPKTADDDALAQKINDVLTEAENRNAGSAQNRVSSA